MRERGKGEIFSVVAAAAIFGASCAATDEPESRREPSRHDMLAGKEIYAVSCASCHGPGGDRIVPLGSSDLVLGSSKQLVVMLLGGMHGPLTDAKGKEGSMPGKGYFADAEIAAVLTFVRNSWGNRAPRVSASTVREVRAARETSG